MDSASDHPCSALKSRKRGVGERLNKIIEIALSVASEAEFLKHEGLLAQPVAFEHLSLRSPIGLAEEVRGFEVRLITRALELTDYNQAQAARLLGLRSQTLNHKIKVYKIKPT